MWRGGCINIWCLSITKFAFWSSVPCGGREPYSDDEFRVTKLKHFFRKLILARDHYRSLHDMSEKRTQHSSTTLSKFSHPKISPDSELPRKPNPKNSRLSTNDEWSRLKNWFWLGRPILPFPFCEHSLIFRAMNELVGLFSPLLAPKRPFLSVIRFKFIKTIQTDGSWPCLENYPGGAP